MKKTEKDTPINHPHVCSGLHGQQIETYDPGPTSDLEDNSIAAPSAIIPVIHTPFFIGFKFHHNGINASGYVFKITQGDRIIKFQGLSAHNRSTPFYSPNEPGFEISDLNIPINIEIYAESRNSNGSTFRSESAKLENVSIARRPVKDSSYEMKYEFNTRYGWNVTDTSVPTAAPWTHEEQSRIQPMLDKIISYFKTKYGNPMSNIPLTVSRLVDANYAIVLKDGYEMRVGPEIDERLLAHELFHAWWCPVWFSVDKYWKYDGTHSWMEEGLAEWAGRDYAAQSNTPDIYSSLWNHNIYDLQNKDFVKNNVNFFWLIQNENLVTTALYGLAATAFSKLIKTNPHNLPWMYNYYAWMINSGEYERLLNSGTPRKEIYFDILTRAFLPDNKIEGKRTKEWLEDQKIFGGELKQGPRIFERIEYYFIHSYTYSRNIFYLVDIFANGESWAEFELSGSSYNIINRYKRNGTGGRLTVTDWNNKIIFEDNVKIEPDQNPPETTIRGSIKVNLVNISKAKYSEVYDNYADDINIPTEENGLYKIKLEFNIENNQKVTTESYRPLGQLDERKYPNGILIGVPDSKYYSNFKVNGISYEVVNDVIIIPELTSELLKLTYEGSGQQYSKERIIPNSKKVNVILFDGLNDGVQEVV